MIYLLHFNTPFKHAKHYLGFVEYNHGLESRLKKHAGGTGSKLMAAISRAGIGFSLARLWPNGDRNYERHLKNLKATTRLCPICNPNAMNRASKEFTSTNEYAVSLRSPSIKSTTYDGTLNALLVNQEII